MLSVVNNVINVNLVSNRSGVPLNNQLVMLLLDFNRKIGYAIRFKPMHVSALHLTSKERK